MSKEMLYIICIYLVIMNMVGFVIMGVDKHNAKCGAWRIPEKVLFLISMIGGSLGTWVGMYAFRHKTKHWYFVIGMPLILAVHVVAGVMLYMK